MLGGWEAGMLEKIENRKEERVKTYYYNHCGFALS
jgi:hypothetical protein